MKIPTETLTADLNTKLMSILAQKSLLQEAEVVIRGQLQILQTLTDSQTQEVDNG